MKITDGHEHTGALDSDTDSDSDGDLVVVSYNTAAGDVDIPSAEAAGWEEEMRAVAAAAAAAAVVVAVVDTFLKRKLGGREFVADEPQRRLRRKRRNL